MKIGELFEPLSEVGSVRSKKRITITGLRGRQATLMAGQLLSAQSILAGVSGQWIFDHLSDEVPSTWTVG